MYHSLLFLAILFFPFSLRSSPLEEIPLSYKGRFRPAEAYARLWLDEIYHSQALKCSHRPLFQSETGSALDFLWLLQVWGHQPFKSSPLFWISSTELKKILHLNSRQNHFSYQELHQALYENQEIGQHIFRHLISYHFLKVYADPVNRSQTQTLELATLMPGLWIQRQGAYFKIISLPSAFSWTRHVEGDLILPEPISNKKLAEDISGLLLALNQFESLIGSELREEKEFQEAFNVLSRQSFAPKEIEQILERDYPLQKRLKMAGTLWKALPGRYQAGEWISLHALKVQVYNPQQNRLLPLTNFTLFSDADFQAIKDSYLAWEQAMLNKEKGNQMKERHQNLLFHLNRAYQNLAGQSYQEVEGKALFYPTQWQLKFETFYYQYPFLPLVMALYGLAALAFILNQLLISSFCKKSGLIFFILAFALHTGILLLRCFILQRPPVSNMFETVIYVPWVGVLASLILSIFLRDQFILLVSSLAAIILLIILQLADLNSSLDNVQAVLDSQFWLVIHVLMVVGSYGLFLLGGILGHLYLIFYLYAKIETPTMRLIARSILQTMYIGTVLLISGTILGGIWAAESWGRFWDWDPKESWAFISSSVYLIWIHAYRFHKITHVGLAIGAITGFLAISFTWYGVNYILGTGLHSYGFGSGGELYYYEFLLFETAFVIYSVSKKNLPLLKSFQNSNYTQVD